MVANAKRGRRRVDRSEVDNRSFELAGDLHVGWLRFLSLSMQGRRFPLGCGVAPWIEERVLNCGSLTNETTLRPEGQPIELLLKGSDPCIQAVGPDSESVPRLPTMCLNLVKRYRPRMGLAIGRGTSSLHHVIRSTYLALGAGVRLPPSSVWGRILELHGWPERRADG